MTKQIHTYNPCSKCGKEVSNIKVVNDVLYCNDCLPKQTKQEWLKQKIQEINLPYYVGEVEELKGGFAIHVSFDDPNEYGDDFWDLENFILFQSSNGNNNGKQTIYTNYNENDFNTIKRLIEIAEQYKKIEELNFDGLQRSIN
jgi:hypothetical protein